MVEAIKVECSECKSELWTNEDWDAEATGYSCPFCHSFIEKEPPVSGPAFKSVHTCEITATLHQTELEAELKRRFNHEQRNIYNKLKGKLDSFEIPASKSDRRRLRAKMTNRECKLLMVKEAGYSSIVWVTWFVMPIIKTIIWEMAKRLYDRLRDRDAE